MSHKAIIHAIVVGVTLLCSCESYNREANCHLDGMHLKGNVVKMETIVQTTVPLTEIYAKAFDPHYALSTYDGNFSIQFDLCGNVKHSTGYGIDGKILFDTDCFKPENYGCPAPAVPIGPGAKQKINRISTISSGNGDVVNVKYFDDNELVWNQKAVYNDDGSIKLITKEYTKLSIKTDLINLLYVDTTSFKYLSHDSLGNWTEAEVLYKGVFHRNRHNYKIKRQITYWNDSENPDLISSLDDYNKVQMISTESFDSVSLGKYGQIEIPHYMALQSKDYISEVKEQMDAFDRSLLDYLFVSVYDKDDAYATFSVNLIPDDDSKSYDELSPEELIYNEATDTFLEEQFTESMEQRGYYVLKWLPYQFVTLSGKNVLKLRYYRYGIGSPIPVYCENYTMKMPDGHSMGIVFSFQSNLYNRFYSDFERAVQSVRF